MVENHTDFLIYCAIIYDKSDTDAPNGLNGATVSMTELCYQQCPAPFRESR